MHVHACPCVVWACVCRGSSGTRGGQSHGPIHAHASICAPVHPRACVRVCVGLSLHPRVCACGVLPSSTHSSFRPGVCHPCTRTIAPPPPMLWCGLGARGCPHHVCTNPHPPWGPGRPELPQWLKHPQACECPRSPHSTSLLGASDLPAAVGLLGRRAGGCSWQGLNLPPWASLTSAPQICLLQWGAIAAGLGGGVQEAPTGPHHNQRNADTPTTLTGAYTPPNTQQTHTTHSTHAVTLRTRVRAPDTNTRPVPHIDPHGYNRSKPQTHHTHSHAHCTQPRAPTHSEAHTAPEPTHSADAQMDRHGYDRRTASHRHACAGTRTTDTHTTWTCHSKLPQPACAVTPALDDDQPVHLRLPHIPPCPPLPHSDY